MTNTISPVPQDSPEARGPEGTDEARVAEQIEQPQSNRNRNILIGSIASGAAVLAGVVGFAVGRGGGEAEEAIPSQEPGITAEPFSEADEQELEIDAATPTTVSAAESPVSTTAEANDELEVILQTGVNINPPESIGRFRAAAEGLILNPLEYADLTTIERSDGTFANVMEHNSSSEVLVELKDGLEDRDIARRSAIAGLSREYYGVFYEEDFRGALDVFIPSQPSSEASREEVLTYITYVLETAIMTNDEELIKSRFNQETPIGVVDTQFWLDMNRYLNDSWSWNPRLADKDPNGIESFMKSLPEGVEEANEYGRAMLEIDIIETDDGSLAYKITTGNQASIMDAGVGTNRYEVPFSHDELPISYDKGAWRIG